MQDYPKCLPSTAKVGFTTLNQVWASYSPVKNSPVDAKAKAADGNPTHSATSAEFDMYKANSLMLKLACGVAIPEPGHAEYNGVPVEVFPKIVLSPSFAPTLADAQQKVRPGSIRVDPSSTVIIDGEDVTVESMEVKGTLVVRAVPGAKVTIRECKVDNKGWEWTPLEQAPSQKEEELIRGFKVVRHETAEFAFNEPGEFIVNGVDGGWLKV